MEREHDYRITVEWTGNTGEGTASYRGYGRDHEVRAAGKPTLQGSADPTFRGEAERWNPEDFLVAALSECHMLSYLALCALEGIVVTAYTDQAQGTMRESARAGGAFAEVVLNPVVTVASEEMRERAEALHEDAHHRCFIANSVNFPVKTQSSCLVHSVA
ncbi:OsmC family protein [Sciscionella marina]|uniref:OsmC family protein n=1 Tax=Sciscionella marina TaxID=508770 RepID=UPI000365018C|nr:OsmC family protein [Sciscionella marina]